MLAALLSVLALSAACARGALLPRQSSAGSICLACPYTSAGDVPIEASALDTIAGTLTCAFEAYPYTATSTPTPCVFSTSTGDLASPSDPNCASTMLTPATYTCPYSDDLIYDAYDATTGILHCGYITANFNGTPPNRECTYDSTGTKTYDGSDFGTCADTLTPCAGTVTRRYKSESNFTAVKRKRDVARARSLARRTSLEVGRAK